MAQPSISCCSGHGRCRPQQGLLLVLLACILSCLHFSSVQARNRDVQSSESDFHRPAFPGVRPGLLSAYAARRPSSISAVPLPGKSAADGDRYRDTELRPGPKPSLLHRILASVSSGGHSPGTGHHKAGEGHHAKGGKHKKKQKKALEDPSPPPAPPPSYSRARPPPAPKHSAPSPSPFPPPPLDKPKKAPKSHPPPPPPYAKPPKAPKAHPPPPQPSASPHYSSPPGPHPPAARNVFSVLSFGAKGDGQADDTEAFQSAWLSACQTYQGVLLAPQGYTFVIGPILFMGPCQPNIVFQVDGILRAPKSPVDWKPATEKLLQWLEFAKLHDMSLQGSGVLDGVGEAWWNAKDCEKFLESKGLMPVELIVDYCSDSPTGVRFYSCVNVTVRDLSLKDSPQVTLKFDNCISINVDNVTISTPANSPNTDGIHLQNTRGAIIQNSVVGSGDDCVSIQTGCANVLIRDSTCGPGHGISIGGLGADGTTACVSNITVENVEMVGTLNGLRIKTWQGGSGSVKFVTFSNISVSNVANPIVIDQYYCNGNSKCKNKTSAVEVSDISYAHIKGTYVKSNAIYLACSDVSPCVDITMTDINLVPAVVVAKKSPNPNMCWNSYGLADSADVCLKSSTPSKSGNAGLKPSQCELL